MSSRSEGAVITSTGKEAKPTCAAQAMPSSRWRTTASESSAGKSSTVPAAPDRELAQAGRAGSHADGDIQGEEAFAAFGFAAEDADGLLGPKTLDQPLGLGAGGWRVGWRVEKGADSWSGSFGGRFGVLGEDFEVEFLVELVPFLVEGGGQEFVGHVHEQAEIAGGVLGKGLEQAPGSGVWGCRRL